VIPYWTPATIFPPSDADVSFTATTNPPTYKTELLIPNTSSLGSTLHQAPPISLSNNGSNIGWRVEGDNSTDHDDDPLLPDDYLIVRNAMEHPRFL
jgi:uncharacterized protein (TIGR02597 family)